MRKVVSIFKQILKRQSYTSGSNQKPAIIPREHHSISRGRISKAALKVLYRLHKAGFAAYLVGGSVRDLLLELDPKDFDVVTDAHPEQIQKLFGNSFIIGRRFRLVHVRFGHEVIEVATFRGHKQNAKGRVQSQHGLLLRDNVYGTLDDDVWRRDFTVNALYYNIADFSVVDYTGGMQDLEHRILRVIGDPVERYREDPARMLRAIRLAGKLDFEIEPQAAEPIKKYKELLLHVPSARLFDKILKIFHSGKSLATFNLMQDFDVFSVLFPSAAASFEKVESLWFVKEAFKRTDARVNDNKTINSAFLFAVLLWFPMQSRKDDYLESNKMSHHQALHLAMVDVLTEQVKTVSIPRKFLTTIREIWYLQWQLENARPRRLYKVFEHPRFRAAYDFLILRGIIDESLQDISDWWTTFQESSEEIRQELIASRFAKSKKRRRKKKRSNEGESVSSAGE